MLRLDLVCLNQKNVYMVKIETQSKYHRGFSLNLVHFEPEIIKSKKLIMLLPGAGYSYLGPLFYYPTQTMLQNGWVVLAVDYDFRNFKNSAELSVDEFLSYCLRESLQFMQKIILILKSHLLQNQ